MSQVCHYMAVYDPDEMAVYGPDERLDTSIVERRSLFLIFLDFLFDSGFFLI